MPDSESRTRELNTRVHQGSSQKENPARPPVKEINRDMSGKMFDNY